jgi:hypothetical protein
MLPEKYKKSMFDKKCKNEKCAKILVMIAQGLLMKPEKSVSKVKIYASMDCVCSSELVSRPITVIKPIKTNTAALINNN